VLVVAVQLVEIDVVRAEAPQRGLDRVEDMLARPLRTSSSLPDRAGLERARSIGAWVKDYEVVLDL